MAHIVTLPNGETAEFPDSMSPEEMSSIISKQFSKQKPSNLYDTIKDSYKNFGHGYAQVLQPPEEVKELAKNVGYGALHGLENTGKSMGFNSLNQAFPNFNPLVNKDANLAGRFANMTGVNTNPGFSVAGAEQGLGEWLPFGGLPGKLSQIIGKASELKHIPELARLIPKNPFVQKLLGSIGAGGIFGETQNPEHPLMGAGLGAAAGGLGHALGAGAGSIGTAAKNYWNQYGIKPLSKEIGEELKHVQSMSNPKAFEQGKENLVKHAVAEEQHWTPVKEKFQSIDESGNYPFDNSKIKESISNKLNSLKEASKKGVGSEMENKEAIDMIKSQLHKGIPDTYSGMIEFNKDLNKLYRQEVTPGRSVPMNIINFMKSQVKDSVENNLKEHNLSGLKKEWDQANRVTQRKNQIFNEVTNKGETNQSVFSKNASLPKKYVNEGEFVNQYIPKVNEKSGIGKMKQYVAMVGDKEKGKGNLIKNYFKNTIQKNGVGINPKPFLTKYNGLDEKQQNFLFNRKQNNAIREINKLHQEHPHLLNKVGFKRALTNSLNLVARDLFGEGSMASRNSLGGMLARNIPRTTLNPLTDLGNKPEKD